MAVLIPDTPKSCPHGERIVFEKFGRDLDDEWIVLHSLGLVEHDKKLWGEIDVVVVSTKGVFAIEVKGGKVSCSGGKWKYEATGRQPYTRDESPWAQAGSAMFAMRKKLLEKDPSLEGMLFGFGVVMPHETFTATGPEIEPAVLLDHQNFARNLRFYIGDLMRHWQGVYRKRYGSEQRLPTAAEIRKIRQHLRPDVDSVFSLGSFFTGLERELVQLTNGQLRAARGIANNVRTVVYGRAGTGKTVIAIDRACSLARSGLRVLHLCFNKMLAKHVSLSLAGQPGAENVRVRHIHSLFREVIDAAGLGGRLRETAGREDSDLFGTHFPEVFVEAALTSEPEPFDAVVVDEAQDVMTPANLDALDILLHGGLRRGQWHLFLDPLQNIYGKLSEDAERRLAEYGYASYELTENCRNTRQVAVQTSIVSGIDMALEGAIDGPECDAVFYGDSNDFLDKLDREVASLLARDVQAQDMIVLSTRRRENSLLAGRETVAGLPIVDLAEDDGSARGIHFATMQGFKGLERDVVLAIDLREIGEEGAAMLHYAGLSRACGLLKAFVPGSERGRYDAQARAFGQRIGGRPVR